MKEVSFRRSTKDSYKSVIFNYHDDVEGSTPLINEEWNHHLESTKLSPIPVAEVKSKFEAQSVKTNDQVLSHESNVKKSLEIETEIADGSDDKMKTNEEDTLIDLQEVAKPTSKKKKNKKNQKVNNDLEEKKKVEAAKGGGSVVLEVEKAADAEINADSTVVSFLEDSHLSQDWL